MEKMEIQQTQHREIGVVTAEIKELKRQAQTMAIAYVIEIGRRLKEAKGFLAHGEWSKWLSDEVDFSQSTATNYMKIYEEYGSDQLTLFGAVANSQTIANLSYAKALKLLSIPSEERESFAATVDAEHLSVRELDEAIKAKKAAEEHALELERKLAEVTRASEEEAAAREASASADSRVEALEEELATAKADFEKKLQEAQATIEEQKVYVEGARTVAERNSKASVEREKELQNAKKLVSASEAKHAEARKELEAAIAEAAKCREIARVAEAKTEEAQKELAEARAKLEVAKPEITAFKTLFDTVKENAEKLKDLLDVIRESDPGTSSKLEKAMHALAEYIGGSDETK